MRIRGAMERAFIVPVSAQDGRGNGYLIAMIPRLDIKRGPNTRTLQYCTYARVPYKNNERKQRIRRGRKICLCASSSIRNTLPTGSRVTAKYSQSTRRSQKVVPAEHCNVPQSYTPYAEWIRSSMGGEVSRICCVLSPFRRDDCALCCLPQAADGSPVV